MITKILDLSTAHVTRPDSILLNKSHESFPLAVYKKSEYGWFVSIPGSLDDVKERIQEILDAGMSQAFANLVVQARTEECDWLMLDCDSDEDRNFPVFSWEEEEE